MDLRLKISTDIAKFGRNIIGVGGDVCPFFYTIGNHTRGQAELLAFGTGDLLNDLSDRFPDGFPDEFKYPTAKFGIKFKLVTEAAHKNYTFQLANYFNTSHIPVYQVVVPDRNGHFPGDSRCEGWFARQPQLWLSN